MESQIQIYSKNQNQRLLTQEVHIASQQTSEMPEIVTEFISAASVATIIVGLLAFVGAFGQLTRIKAKQKAKEANDKN